MKKVIAETLVTLGCIIVIPPMLLALGLVSFAEWVMDL